ncbi:TPA: hypothetical protein P1J70_001792 [Clostridioides difficile]|uniref:hypothetical protein n=1 Tax=Clostridioides difficile TaxID=1496 RepID=UPI000938B88C|nr:hypothetical protein [Clostridioides difficile]EGT5050671.1 hypothetical protein [Clostridioides difficile]EGT5490592.1 hypothetical protein [Clostridioides difficile]EGT5525354.1 hypothetical protein [Clostridioides difficile]EGT5560716.1 hypothetical protein [Clostridioides difficile]EGT5564756.1 hypothetical protein [Clostridioides difficile]
MRIIYKNKVYKVEQDKKLFRITYYDEQRGSKKFNKDKKVKRSTLTRDTELVNLYLPSKLKINKEV